MNDLLPKIFDSDYVLPKIFVGLMLAILFWSFFGPTEPEYDAHGTKVGNRRARSVRTKNRQDKEEFLAKMLAKEKDLRAKYKHKFKQNDDNQGIHKGRQAFHKQKARKQKILDRVKNEDSKNPDSIKAHAQKTLRELDEDRPE